MHITEEAGLLLNDLRVAILRAEDMCKLPDIGNVFEPPAPQLLHLPDLDNLVKPAEHTKSIIQLTKAELTLWGASWADSLQCLMKEIESAIPSGWVLKKNDLLLESNSDTVTSLLTNVAFQRLSKGVTSLCEKVTILQSVRRSSGQHLLQPTTWEAVKATLGFRHRDSLCDLCPPSDVEGDPKVDRPSRKGRCIQTSF